MKKKMNNYKVDLGIKYYQPVADKKVEECISETVTELVTRIKEDQETFRIEDKPVIIDNCKKYERRILAMFQKGFSQTEEEIEKRMAFTRYKQTMEEYSGARLLKKAIDKRLSMLERETQQVECIFIIERKFFLEQALEKGWLITAEIEEILGVNTIESEKTKEFE